MLISHEKGTLSHARTWHGIFLHTQRRVNLVSCASHAYIFTRKWRFVQFLRERENVGTFLRMAKVFFFFLPESLN